MIKKFKWTKEEIELLEENFEKYHDRKFHNISEHLPNKTIRQAQARWIQNSEPKLDNSRKWTEDEDELLMKLFYQDGSQWKKFVQYFEGRSSVYLRNRYYELIRKIIKKEKEKEKEIRKIIYLHEENNDSDMYRDMNIETELEIKRETETETEIETETEVNIEIEIERGRGSGSEIDIYDFWLREKLFELI
jgi:hypothetical protein